MTAERFDHASALADGLAHHVHLWATAAGATPDGASATASAACTLSLATSAGHVCLPLTDLVDANLPGAPADVAAWRHTLLASGVVARAGETPPRPLVLDAQDRLYLLRDFMFEHRLAARLARCAAPLPAPGPAARQRTADLLAQLFASNAQGDGGVDWQCLAAALALRGRLTIISGGPGTGKTTTVVNLLACLLAHQPEARVVLAAPTGKAAARLSEALRQRAGHLPEALRQRLPSESFTLHRLLGVRPPDQTGGADHPFVHHASHPLALDVLVVDEASMLDLALATRLLEAVPEHARIVLLGDKDQLSAVESGAVFADLSADPSLSLDARQDIAGLCGITAEQIVPSVPAQPSALRDCVVWFNRNFRFAADSGIGRLAADTVAGRPDSALAWLRAGSDPSARWLDDDDTSPQPATLDAAADGYAPYQEALQAALLAAPTNAGLAGAPHAAACMDAFNRFRVLCAVREGPRGVSAINRWMSQQITAALGLPAPEPGRAWFAGRPVMVLQNDAALRLFNGDIGITLPDAQGSLAVYFPAADGGFRAVAPLRLPPHQTAFAMTVHKSQGSEFDAVLVLLPAQRNRVLGRELLYTAITRARQRVVLAAGAPVLASAIQARSQRRSGLLSRLAQACGAPTG